MHAAAATAATGAVAVVIVAAPGVARMPPSSIVVCMPKNPNRDGLVRTQRGVYALTGRGRHACDAG